jgi:hypothetical protein
LGASPVQVDAMSPRQQSIVMWVAAAVLAVAGLGLGARGWLDWRMVSALRSDGLCVDASVTDRAARTDVTNRGLSRSTSVSVTVTFVSRDSVPLREWEAREARRRAAANPVDRLDLPFRDRPASGPGDSTATVQLLSSERFPQLTPGRTTQVVYLRSNPNAVVELETLRGWSPWSLVSGVVAFFATSLILAVLGRRRAKPQDPASIASRVR